MPAARKSNGTIALPPTARSKDINYYPYFQGGISRGLWRFITYRFTKSTGLFLGLTLIFVMYGSNSLEIQTYTPVAYFLCAWIVVLVTARLSRPRVTLDVSHADRVSVGETLPIELTVVQQRSRVQELNIIPNRLPPALDSVPLEGVRLPPLGKGEKTRVTLGLACTRRGRHEWHGFRVENDFPFGLFRSYRTILERDAVLVTPRFTRLVRLNVPTGRRYQPGGIAMASRLGDSFEYIGNREYRQGDNLRDMDWRAMARLNRPIVREYREEYFLRVGVVLDTYLPKNSDAACVENFERAVSLAAGVSDYMARSDYIVDLFAAGPNLYHLTAGRSLAYLDQILEILACVEGSKDEPFAILEPEIVDHLAQITSVVCIFLDWDERREEFTRLLLQQGAGLKVIVVRDVPCSLNTQDADLPGGITVLSAVDIAAGVEEL